MTRCLIKCREKFVFGPLQLLVVAAYFTRRNGKIRFQFKFTTRIFTCLNFHTSSGTHTSSYAMATVLHSGIRRLELRSHYFLPKLLMRGALPSPPYLLMARCLIKDNGKFIFRLFQFLVTAIFVTRFNIKLL